MNTIQYVPVLVLVALSMVASSGCTAPPARSVPPDFTFILDAHSPEGKTLLYMRIKINSEGEGHFERYDTGVSIGLGQDGTVVLEIDQLVDTGGFLLREHQVDELWQTIDEHDFFQLTGDYRMAIGYSYAFIRIEADGQSHQVFNIGMEVPEIRAIVEEVSSILPSDVVLVYGGGPWP